MTQDHISKRLRFARWWRKMAHKFKIKPKMFSDEKWFAVDGGLNSQNMRIYALSSEEADANKGKILINSNLNNSNIKFF
jgi:hypothetical protein